MSAAPGARGRLGHVPVDGLTRDAALERLAGLVDSGRGGLVFTPNVDHVILADEHPSFRAAYAAASLSLVDGMPVLWACRLLGQTVPERLSGADLLEPLLALAARRGWRVAVLGGGAGAAEEALARLAPRLPGLQVAATLSPDIDMEAPPQTRAAAWDALRSCAPQLVLLALGSPKGELFAHEARGQVPGAVFASVGAAIDFAAGRQRRAPRWVSRLGFEWLHRLLSQPRRLWRRYLVRGPRFLPIVLRSARDARRGG